VLGAAIAAELKHKRYQWRLPRDGSGADPGQEDDPGGVGAKLAKWAKDLVDAIEKKLEAWMRKLFGDGEGEPGVISGFGGAFTGIGVLQAIVYACLALILAAAVWFGLRAFRRRKARLAAAGAGPALPQDVDLESEDVLADALEEDQWLTLARTKSEAGEFRLAVRAVFLACLAHLSERKVVNLQKFKSNRDYLDEVARKARGHADLKRSFGDTTGAFERVWYGEHAADPELCDELRANFNRIREDV
jgi:hypothetical protein